MKQSTSTPSWLLPTLLLVAMTAAAAAYTPTKDPASVQLSPGVLVMGEYDWTLSTGPTGQPTSRCLDMVARARQYSAGNKLNFVLVHHWLPNSDGFGVSSYCYMHTGSGNQPGDGVQGTCLPWTAEKLGEFKRSLTYCFTEALKQGFTPYVRPYLDDGAQRGVWRNGLLFSPTTKYGDYSFMDLMIRPMAEAMRDSLAAASKAGKLVTPPDRARPVVYMALTGEMSATVMRYAADYATLPPVVKSIVGTSLADVKVGAGLNFNALDGVESQPLDGASTATQTPSLFNFFTGSYSAAPAVKHPPSVPRIDAAGVRDLLSNKLDFLSVSAYYPYSSASFSQSEFPKSAVSVGDSLASLAAGVNLADLSNSRLELHYGEFGIGCGVDGNSGIAPSADACARAPWAGICGKYNTASDPWRRSDLSSFRTSFYNKALGWLSQSADSSQYKISEVFVWSMSSWDVFGLYPESMEYRDLSIVRKVAAHNAAVLAAQACEYGSTQVCDRFVAANSACLNDQSGTACLNRPSSASVVTEAGPAQAPSTASSPPATEQQQSGGADNSSDNLEAGMMDAGAIDGVAPGAVSPLYMQASAADVVTSTGKPNVMFVGVQPQKPTSALGSGSTSAAGGRQQLFLQEVSMVVTLLCSVVLLVLW